MKEAEVRKREGGLEHAVLLSLKVEKGVMN